MVRLNLRLDQLTVGCESAGPLKTGAHRGLNVGATEGGHLAQLSWDLNAVVQQQAQLTLISFSVGIGD